MESFKLSKEQYCDLMKLDRTNAVNLFLYLLANADDNGVLIVSIRTISTELCIGVQVVRTLLKKMYATHQLTHQLTHLGSEITICNICSYKGRKKSANTPTNTPTNTPKTPDERKKTFADGLRPYLAKYGSTMLNAFYSYWTEMSPGGKKMRFEKEKVFDVQRRLNTWNSNNYGNRKANNKPTAEQLAAKAARILGISGSPQEPADEFE
jgi:hypothetical protein